jgi:hypothetical protein
MAKKIESVKGVKMWTAKGSVGKDPCICVPESGRMRLVLIHSEPNVIPVMIVPITPKRRKK